MKKKTYVRPTKTLGWLAMAFFCAITFLVSCSNEDSPTRTQQEYTGVPLVILDTDIGSSTDDLFAMMMLYRYQNQNRSRLLGVVVDREGEISRKRSSTYGQKTWISSCRLAR